MRKNKSAIKKAKQSEEKRLRNSHVKSTMKTYIKKVTTSIGNKENQQTEDNLKKAVSYINKAASKGVIHKKNASRKVSRLTKKANALLSAKS